MGFKGQFGSFWDRLSRSTPLFGIVASLFLMPSRLQRETEEDAAYRAMMFQLGAKPRFVGHSMKREKEIVFGEFLGHLLALVTAFVIWRAHPVPFDVFLATWVVAFILDYLGGKAAAWNFKRRQPSTEEIVESIFKDENDS